MAVDDLSQKNLELTETAVEAVNSLTRSPIRVFLLQKLAEEYRCETHELRDSIEVARTTIQRNLNELQTHGWVESSNGVYSITPCGEMVEAALSEILETVRTARSLDEFMEWIPANRFDLDPELLANATVIPSDPNNPYAPVNRHIECLETTARFRGILPIIGRDAFESSVQRIRDGDQKAEIITEHGVAEVLRTNQSYTAYLSDIEDSPAFKLWVVNEPIPFFIGVYDDVVHLGAEDDQGIPRALVESNNDDVRSWAVDRISRLRQRAERLY